MNLDEVRSELVKYEDKIIKSYIEASKYRRDNSNYVNELIINIKKNINNDYHYIADDMMNAYLLFILNCNGNAMTNNLYEKDYDIMNLIMNRIMIGEKVIKSKIEQNKEKYYELIRNKDVAKLYELLENKVVENNIIQRLKNKNIENYTDDIKNDIVKLYENYIIPYTKKIQIIYCLNLVYIDNT